MAKHNPNSYPATKEEAARLVAERTPRIPHVYATTGYKGKECRWHVIVFIANYGPVPKDHIINHINGNTLDNRPENLQAVTFYGNSIHQRQKKRKVGPGQDWPVHHRYKKGRPNYVCLSLAEEVNGKTVYYLDEFWLREDCGPNFEHSIAYVTAAREAKLEEKAHLETGTPGERAIHTEKDTTDDDVYLRLRDQWAAT